MGAAGGGPALLPPSVGWAKRAAQELREGQSLPSQQARLQNAQLMAGEQRQQPQGKAGKGKAGGKPARLSEKMEVQITTKKQKGGREAGGGGAAGGGGGGEEEQSVQSMLRQLRVQMMERAKSRAEASGQQEQRRTRAALAGVGAGKKKSVTTLKKNILAHRREKWCVTH